MEEKDRNSRRFEEPLRGHGHRRRRRRERVMHTRISRDLDEALRSAAEDLRVPVSNLVRNLLEDAFDVVETVTESIGSLVDDVVGEAQELKGRFRDDWQTPTREAVRQARERVREARGEARERFRQATQRADGEPAPEADQGVEPPPSAGPDREELPDVELPEFPGIMGWQPFVLNTAQDCAGCGRSLTRGGRAYLGISATGRPASYLCGDCIDALS